jgi:hypothetical protein
MVSQKKTSYTSRINFPSFLRSKVRRNETKFSATKEMKIFDKPIKKKEQQD